MCLVKDRLEGPRSVDPTGGRERDGKIRKSSTRAPAPALRRVTTSGAIQNVSDYEGVRKLKDRFNRHPGSGGRTSGCEPPLIDLGIALQASPPLINVTLI